MIPKQFRIHAVLVVACVFMIIFPILNDRPDGEKAEQAIVAATDFLQLVDAEKYAESWRGSALLMKEKVTEQEWVEQLTKARDIYGAAVERRQDDISYSTTAKDGPEGEYITIVFDARYQRAEKFSEYVFVMLEDGRWKVAGYFGK